MNRRRKLYLNTVMALVKQCTVLICGFILPHYILLCFGSDINGLVNSITRFLSVISFLELGIGPVVQSNLYKPLANKDNETVSKIIVSAEKFYRRIAFIFLAYIVVLLFVYPNINAEFDFLFTGSLLLIISISTFVQYYFGLTYQVFLNADQKVYVHLILQTVTVILNTFICVFLMKWGCSIHIVKLVSTLVYIIRPIGQNIYVKKNYTINKKITYTEEPIKQKWNGFVQHLAAVVCGEIDVVLLTFFASYQCVSIYSVYQLVVTGITNIIMTTVSGLESFWGNMIAKGENVLLLKTFEAVECLIHACVTIIFISTAILIAPFVQVYVNGIEDSVLYYLPDFGMLLTFAYASQCLRVPYYRMIKAAGHYKQTQGGALISMGLNIVISVVLVFKYQLIGVAIGTVIAMLYHTLYSAWYLRKNIINRPFKYIVYHLLVDILICILSYGAVGQISMQTVCYKAWIIYAVEVALIVTVITLIINLFLYRKIFSYVLKRFVGRSD